MEFRLPDEKVGQSHIGKDASHEVSVRLRPDQYSRYFELSRRQNLPIGEIVLQELEEHDTKNAGPYVALEAAERKEQEALFLMDGIVIGFSVGIVLTGTIFTILRLVRRK